MIHCSDYTGVSEAYEAMKNVASLINERKRRLESIDTIAHWQVAILHWEVMTASPRFSFHTLINGLKFKRRLSQHACLQGSNVLERSSELIHSGELTRVVRQGKMQQRSFFLFDHQLIYCKKDVLRRDLLHYRGRLDTDQTEVLDVPDGRDQDLGLTLRNGLRLRNASTLELVCVLCCRKAEDKQKWIEAFARERNRVKEDQEMGESRWKYLVQQASTVVSCPKKKKKRTDQRRKRLAGNVLIGRCVLCSQEWKSVKNKESRLLLMPDGPNKGRTKVERHFPLCLFLLSTVCCFYFNVMGNLVLFHRHELLWFRPTTSPESSPASPASRHHSNQRASAAGVLTG